MPNADENAEKQELSLTAGGKAQWYPATLEHGLTCHKAKHSLHMQPSNHTPRNLSNAFEDLHPHKQLHENVYRSFIHNSQIEKISTGKYIFLKKKRSSRNFPMIQWSRRCVFTAGGSGSIPGQGSSMPHSAAKKKKNHLPHNGILLRKKRVNCIKPCKNKDES